MASGSGIMRGEANVPYPREVKFSLVVENETNYQFDFRLGYGNGNPLVQENCLNFYAGNNYIVPDKNALAYYTLGVVDFTVMYRIVGGDGNRQDGVVRFTFNVANRRTINRIVSSTGVTFHVQLWSFTDVVLRTYYPRAGMIVKQRNPVSDENLRSTNDSTLPTTGVS